MTDLSKDIKFGLQFTPGSVKWSWGSSNGYGFIERQTIQLESGAITNEEILHVATIDLPESPTGEQIIVDGKTKYVSNKFVNGDGLETTLVLSNCR